MEAKRAAQALKEAWRWSMRVVIDPKIKGNGYGRDGEKEGNNDEL